MEVYVLIHWFNEGDGYLVGEFKSVHKTKKEARGNCTEDYEFVTEWREDYPDTPKEWFGSESKYEIRECKI